MRMYIPNAIVTKITHVINENFKELNNKQRARLIKILIELWYFIYNYQTTDKEIVNLDGYSNISKTLFKKFKIKLNNKRYEYRFLLDILRGNNLIDINENYRFKSKGDKYKKTESNDFYTKGYRVKTDLIQLDFKEIELDFNKIFGGMKEREYYLEKYPNHQKIINNLYNVKIDLSKYIDWLRDNEGSKLKAVIKNGVVHERILDKDRIYNYINEALKINFENLWFKISDEGRFYNSNTNMSYTAIPFMIMNGEEVYEVDVKNCQPLLLSTLISNKKYKRDVEEGVFYDNMAKELNKERGEFKNLSYLHIFFSNNKLKQGKIYEALERLYPNFITDLNELRDDFDSREGIANRLQKLESTIIVDKIGLKVDFDLILRHDAILVNKKDIEEASNLIRKEFEELGLKATIK